MRSDQRIVWAGIEDNVNANSSAQKVITAVKLIRRNNSETLRSEPVAMLLVNYSVDYIYNHFKDVDLGRGAYLLVIDAQSQIIYHPDRRLLGAQASSALVDLLKANQGAFERSINGQKTLITYTRSPMSNWVVLSFVPLNTLVKPALPIGMATTLALSISFSIILGAAWVVSAQLVEPIRQIIQRFQLLQQGSSSWQTPLVARGYDEIAELSRWFNTFLESVSARERAERSLRDGVERERATLRVVERMRQSLDLRQIFNATTDELQQLLKCDRVVIFQLDSDDSGRFVAESTASKWTPWIQNDKPNSARIEEDRCIVNLWNYPGSTSDKTELSEHQNDSFNQPKRYSYGRDVYQMGFQQSCLKLLEQLQVRAYLIVPILQGNELWGLLACYHHTNPHGWEDTEIGSPFL